LRICFVTGLAKFGAERQTSKLVQLLSQHHDVAVVGFVPSGRSKDRTGWQPDPEIVQYRMGYVNYFVFAHAALVKALRKLDPDVCIQRAVGDLTGFVGTYCRLHNCRFVYHSATNWDPTSQIALWLSATPISLLYYNLGLVLSDAIVAQTHDVAARFRRRFAGTKRVEIVPQIYDAVRIKPPHIKEDYALWIGRLTWYKRPEVFLNLARTIPERRFVMAGSGPMQSYVEARARNIPNLRFLGAVEHEVAEELCGKANVFVNTSMIEGFPNTMLECAARETPFITLEYDPDEMICKHRIGLHSRSFERLKKDVELVMSDDRLRTELGRNGRQYVIENHSPELGLKAYERLLYSLPIKHHNT
jgi:glycosyltransferase involved in cell wall biosynthesis